MPAYTGLMMPLLLTLIQRRGKIYFGILNNPASFLLKKSNYTLLFMRPYVTNTKKIYEEALLLSDFVSKYKLENLHS